MSWIAVLGAVAITVQTNIIGEVRAAIAAEDLARAERIAREDLTVVPAPLFVLTR